MFVDSLNYSAKVTLLFFKFNLIIHKLDQHGRFDSLPCSSFFILDKICDNMHTCKQLLFFGWRVLTKYLGEAWCSVAQ